MASVVVGEPPAACFVAPALALALTLWMRAAGRGREEVEDDEEDEDEEEVVFLGDAGCAAMGAGLALRNAAASAAATAGRMEAISSGSELGASGCKGPVVIWRPGGLDLFGSGVWERCGSVVARVWVWLGWAPAI